jgi:hypothetical protein
MKTIVTLALCILSVVFFGSCGVNQQSRICGNNNTVIQNNYGGGGYSNPRHASSEGRILRSPCGKYRVRVIPGNPIRVAPIGNCPPRIVAGIQAHVRRNPSRYCGDYGRYGREDIRGYYNRSSRYDQYDGYRSSRRSYDPHKSERLRRYHQQYGRYIDNRDRGPRHSGLFGFTRGTTGIAGWLNN